MTMDLEQLSSVQKRHISIDHSLGAHARPSLADTRYLLLSPHDASDEESVATRIGAAHFPDEVLDEMEVLGQVFPLKHYLQSERDAGVNELRRRILQICNGGVSVSVELNRGICNLNNEGTREGKVPNIWKPEARRIVEPQLLAIHSETLGDIDAIFRELRQGVKIICLHSMDPWGFPKGARPALSPENFDAYVHAQDVPPEKKKRRVNDFITGKEKGPVLADQEFYRFMKGLFDQEKIPWADNDPYDTEEGYPDYRYMLDYPGRVSAVDLLKTSLCHGSFEDFDWRNPVADPAKIEHMADIHRFAIEASAA